MAIVTTVAITAAAITTTPHTTTPPLASALPVSSVSVGRDITSQSRGIVPGDSWAVRADVGTLMHALGLRSIRRAGPCIGFNQANAKKISTTDDKLLRVND